jgi:hypothetical protein
MKSTKEFRIPQRSIQEFLPENLGVNPPSPELLQLLNFCNS